ncbi:MAG: tetratricopeptide repeat protein [Pseudomonadota bacterium]
MTRLIAKYSLACLLCLAFSLPATSSLAFPFLYLAPNDELPPITIKNLHTGEALAVKKFRGRPALLVFWGADITEKEQRSITLMRELENLAPFFEERRIPVLFINVQGDAPEKIRTVSQAVGAESKVYLDQERVATGAMGLYIMPSVVLADQKGRAVFSMGYSHDMTEILKGEVEILLAEKTAAQVEAERHPIEQVHSAAEKTARCYIAAGLLQKNRQQVEGAVRSFQQALAADPDSGTANIELGCLYLEQHNVAQAKVFLTRGLDLMPQSTQARLCQAKLLATEGLPEAALKLVTDLKQKQPENHAVMATMAALHEQNRNPEAAAKAYHDAYLLLKHQAEEDLAE